jgi:hypothetical protein
VVPVDCQRFPLLDASHPESDGDNVPHISRCCFTVVSSTLNVALPAATSWSILRYGGTSRYNCPSGPVTVTVLVGTCNHFVGSFFVVGCPISSSTPGGMEMGVRPSLDALLVVVAKVRRVWKAGTKKLGRVTTDGEEVMTLSSALPLLGANMLAGRTAGWSSPEFEAHLIAGLKSRKCSMQLVASANRVLTAVARASAVWFR